MTRSWLAADAARTYLWKMMRVPALFRMLIALVLIGAPFGMGRMMDNAAGHATAQHRHHDMGTGHEPLPSHEPSAPHYMVCSACVAAPASVAELVRVALDDETPDLMIAETLNGTRFLPPVPPPRA